MKRPARIVNAIGRYTDSKRLRPYPPFDRRQLNRHLDQLECLIEDLVLWRRHGEAGLARDLSLAISEILAAPEDDQGGGK